MSSLLLVRHGQTDANRDGVLLGRSDPDLNATGLVQAAAIAERVAALAPVRVLASPLRRAASTAAVIADACGLAVEVDERLIEVDYGVHEGTALADLPPELVLRWRTDADFAPERGESLASVQVRAGEFATDVLATLRTGPVVAVSHVSPIKAVVCWALGLAPLHQWRMRLDNATLTRLAPGPDGPVLLSFNER